MCKAVSSSGRKESGYGDGAGMGRSSLLCYGASVRVGPNK